MVSDAVGTGATPAEPVADPQQLLGAANDASAVARNTWLAFLGVLAYMVIALGGIRHTDLLLDNPVMLPIINVPIPLSGFFVVAPVLVLILHFNLLVQQALVAHKYFRFARALAEKKSSDPRNHPLRFLVHNYVFAQLLAGPERPWVITLMMRAMVWLTVSALPVLTLLFFQVRFLPAHDKDVTLLHQGVIIVDVLMLIFLKAFYVFPSLIEERSSLYSTAFKSIRAGQWRQVQWRGLFFSRSDGDQRVYWSWNKNILSLIRSLVFGIFIMIFSVTVVTVPGSNWDERMVTWLPWLKDTVTDNVTNYERPVFLGTKLLFENDKITWLRRNLVVSNEDLVSDQSWEPDESSFALRNRKLHYAELVGADLRRVDLSEAELNGANLTLADLRGANLNLTFLNSAKLDSTNMQGAKLEGAILQGAYMFGVNLQGADLTGADLRGAYLHSANLQGAIMSSANLEGAYLYNANLHGADLSNASVNCANFTRAKVWLAKRPSEMLRSPTNCDAPTSFDNIVIDEPSPSLKDSLDRMLTALDNIEGVFQRVESRLASLGIRESKRDAQATPEPQVWNDEQWWIRSRKMSNLRSNKKLLAYHTERLSKALAKLACDNDTPERHIARGLIKWRTDLNEFEKKLNDLIDDGACPSIGPGTKAPIQSDPPGG